MIQSDYFVRESNCLRQCQQTFVSQHTNEGCDIIARNEQCTLLIPRLK